MLDPRQNSIYYFALSLHLCSQHQPVFKGIYSNGWSVSCNCSSNTSPPLFLWDLPQQTTTIPVALVQIEDKLYVDTHILTKKK